VKRAFDLTVAFLALVITSPIVVAAAIGVKLESRGPAFYSGPRVGLNGRPFRIHKLRTMRVGADGIGPAVTAAGDSRITSVGRLLRRTKADELPQLVNVLKGEMSLVGPRPEHPDYVKHYTTEQRLCLSVRPGMTGPTAIAYIDEEQILGAGDAETTYLREVMPRKLALDLDYVRTASFAGDLRILLKTAALLLRRPFASSSPGRQP
jgi:lipopolysaccharide/colanic/teichoic acid biosynthesis glycosyltransferase